MPGTRKTGPSHTVYRPVKNSRQTFKALSHIKTSVHKRWTVVYNQMSTSLCQGWGRQGQAILCLSSHKECQINCLRRLAIKRQWLERMRETGPSHTVYRPGTSIRQSHLWTVSVTDEIIQCVPSVLILQKPPYVTATQQQSCTKMREENKQV